MNPINTQTNIDVIIPVYNGEKFIRHTIDSVISQTRPPQKIIVVNDGSTDTTINIVEEFQETSIIPIEIITKANGGLSSARNAGIRVSTSPLVAFLDADDIWENTKLEKQLAVYTTHTFPKLGLVYCGYDIIDSQGKKDTAEYIVPLDQHIRGMVFKRLLSGNKILSSGSGVLIKKEVFEKVGLFDETLTFGEDWDMWLRIAREFEVDFTQEVLVHIRRHSKNMTADSRAVFEGELSFYTKWISEIKGAYPLPTHWSDKIAFRIISRLPKMDFIDIVKEKISQENYRLLFEKTFGSFLLYIPYFALRQIFKVIMHPRTLGKTLAHARAVAK